jgi:hypothetical protein
MYPPPHMTCILLCMCLCMSLSMCPMLEKSFVSGTPQNLVIPHHNIPKMAINASLRAPPALQHQRPYFRNEDEPTNLGRHLGGSSHELESKLSVGANAHEPGALIGEKEKRTHELGAALGGLRSWTGVHQVVVGTNVDLHLQACWDRDYGSVVTGPVTGPVTACMDEPYIIGMCRGLSLHPGARARWRPA